jgi:hypothetical protein
MKTRTAPLLCELHAHTKWSDGALSLRELVDLYGGLGFDPCAKDEQTLVGYLRSELPVYLTRLDIDERVAA